MTEEIRDQTRYALGVRVPREIEVRIEDTYLSFLGSTKPYMGYHITLLGPFYILESAESQFGANVANLCKRWQPFRVQVTGLGTFLRKDDNVVYLSIANPETLLALHADLLKTLADRISPQDEYFYKWDVKFYQPHVTLGLGLTDKRLEEFLSVAAACKFDESFEVSRIWLASQAQNGPWQYIASYPLGSTKRETSSTALYS